jgi:hypothetical protein
MERNSLPRFVAGPPRIRRASLPEGPQTVRALIDAGLLHEGDIVQCGDHLAAILSTGWLRVVARVSEPFRSLSSAARWALGRSSANGWTEWRLLRDGELLADKRDQWIQGTAAA